MSAIRENSRSVFYSPIRQQRIFNISLLFTTEKYVLLIFFFRDLKGVAKW